MAKNEFQGTPGESLVQYLASKDGILASTPQRDEFGWDLHLQFKSNASMLIWDESESNYNVYVQVKEFHKAFEDYSGRSIKLSNIRHMVTSNAPFFVIYAQPDNNEIYLVHIDSKIIEHGLKKIREAQVTNKPLHETTLVINPHTYGSERVDLSGSLKNKLIEIIGNSPRRYVENKIRHVKTAGYAGGALQIIGKVPERDLLDVELGIKGSVEIELSEFNHLRFDIPIPYPKKPIKVELISNEYAASLGLLENTIPTNEEFLLCVNEDSLPLSLRGKLRVSSQSAKYGVFAFDSDYFKLVISQGESSSVNVTFYWSKLLASSITIDELRHQLRVANILFNKDEKKFGFAVLDDGLCSRTLIESDGADRSDILNLASVLDNFEILMKTLAIKLSTPISPGELFAYRHKYSSVLKLLFNNELGVIRFSNLQGVNSGSSTLLFVPIQIRVIDKEYIVTLRVQGNIKVLDDYGYFSQNYSKTLLSPVKADIKSVRSLFKNIGRLLKKDKENQYKIVIDTAMDNKLASAVKDFYEFPQLELPPQV